MVFAYASLLALLFIMLIHQQNEQVILVLSLAISVAFYLHQYSHTKTNQLQRLLHG